MPWMDLGWSRVVRYNQWHGTLVLIDPRAITPTEQTASDEWRKKDRKAKSEIFLWISDKYLVYIDQTTTVSEL